MTIDVELDRSIRDRISLVRFLMIFGVVMLHTPAYVPLSEIGTTAFDLIKAFFQHALFRATIPMLTVVSGYLLFRSGLDREPGLLIQKKARSILLPFLCFNLPLVVVAILIEAFSKSPMSYQLLPFELETWMNAAFGVTEMPINYPLNFLRDLMVLILLAPLFGKLIRTSPWLGFMLVITFFHTNTDGTLILRDTMPILFYLGGMAAIHRWNIRLLDSFALPCLALFLLLCILIVQFRVGNTTYLRLVAPMLIWPFTSSVVDTRVGRWAVQMSKYSFFIFIAHAPVLLATWLLQQHLLALPYPLYWVAAPILTSAVLVWVYRASEAVVPNLFSLILGNRARSVPVLSANPVAKLTPDLRFEDSKIRGSML